MGIAGRTHFLGRRDDVADLLAASDLFCLPSHFEGHPLALMEAMADGLPVVSTRSPGITEVVKIGESGILVPVANPMALAAALMRILSDKKLANHIGQRGRQILCDEFTVEQMAHAPWRFTGKRCQSNLQTSMAAPNPSKLSG